jgi:hypothetical protein
MNILQQPPAITGTFNPVLLKLQQGDEPSADVTVFVDNREYQLSRDYLNGTARYNLTGIIKQEFHDEQTTVIENIFTDKLLAVAFGSTQSEIQFDSAAIRAVSQRRGMYDMTPMRGKFLTGFDEIKQYAGYPLYLSFLTFSGNTYININGITHNDESLPGVHLTLLVPNGTTGVSLSQDRLTVPLLTNSGNKITTNSGRTIVVSTGILESEGKKNVNQSCDSQSPLYVRWVNRFGGWDCWMFKHRQFKKSELSKVETFYPVIEDYSVGPAESDRVLSAEAKETIITGEENLTGNEFDNLQALKYSPLIQQYNKDTGEWSRIYLEKADAEKDTGATRFALEFEFTLPTPKLQF